MVELTKGGNVLFAEMTHETLVGAVASLAVIAGGVAYDHMGKIQKLESDTNGNAAVLQNLQHEVRALRKETNENYRSLSGLIINKS